MIVNRHDAASDLVKNTYVVEPLPRIHPVKIPVLFGSSGVSNAASATLQGRKRARGQTGATSDVAGKNGPGDEHEDDDKDESHVVQELNGLMRVLENLKPKVGRGGCREHHGQGASIRCPISSEDSDVSYDNNSISNRE